MKNTANITIILDSILDDYYLLWECFSEYSQMKPNESDPLVSFSQSQKEAFELEYFNFYEGVNFDRDEVLMTAFILNDSMIGKLLTEERL